MISPVRLQLQELEDEAHEAGGLALAPKRPTKMIDLHGLINKGLCCEPKAVLLPVDRIVDLHAQDLLNEILHATRENLSAPSCRRGEWLYLLPRLS